MSQTKIGKAFYPFQNDIFYLVHVPYSQKDQRHISQMLIK